MTPKKRDFHEIQTFLEVIQEAFRKLLGHLWRSLDRFRVPGINFRKSKTLSDKIGKLNILMTIAGPVWAFSLEIAACTH